jgi:hypothetical protein
MNERRIDPANATPDTARTAKHKIHAIMRRRRSRFRRGFWRHEANEAPADSP